MAGAHSQAIPRSPRFRGSLCWHPKWLLLLLLLLFYCSFLPLLQKDPGEYLLELQQFAAVAHPQLRRHRIDMHLRWVESAARESC